MSRKKLLVSVIGGHKCSRRTAAIAEAAGREIALAGAVLVSGGLGGVMEAASRGAASAGGLTVGIVPGGDKNAANRYVDISIATGMGYSRNTLVAGAADIVVAFPGSYGTLSEIGFAMNSKKPVYGFDSWKIKGVRRLRTASELRRVLETGQRQKGRG